MIRKIVAWLAVLALCTGAALGAAAPGTGREAGLDLTPEEQAYVQQCGPLKVGYVQDRIPVSFQDENGELGGISRYIFDRIQQISGLEFEYAALPNGSVTYDYLLGEGFDLITSVEYNKENLNANGILISEPYLSSRKVVVAREGLEFRYDADLSVAISTGSQTIKKVLGRIFPNFVLEDYDSISACFDAVSAGQADLMIQNQYVAEYWIYRPAYEGLTVIPVLGLEDQLCFSAVLAFGEWDGPSQEDGQLLIRVLNKAIARLAEDEVASYTIQAVMENPYTFTFSDFLYRYRYAAVALTAAGVVIIALTVLLLRQRLRSMEDRAEAKARGQFLSTMSHEIRTPLNGLIGLNYLMSQKLDDRERLDGYLRQSTATAKYLLSLVNDILDMSKLQEQRMELARDPVDLELMVSTLQAIVQNTMTERGLDFRVEAELPWPCVLGDEVRIQQVLMNLLDNARKFTPSGGQVRLRIEQSRGGDGAVLTKAVVSDTGRGMSEEFQRRVFDAFAQERDTVSKGNEGTGLGLPISRRLARLMGGDLTFESRRGEGSRFVFTFPGQPVQPPEGRGEPAPAGGKARFPILVAEDNELNAEIMLDLLESEGFETTLAKNGREALRLFQESEPGTYGAVLMDLLMPEMDGLQAAAAIRALDRPDAKTVKIIACTANSFAEDRASALESGMDDFVAKPVDIDELLRKLSQ